MAKGKLGRVRKYSHRIYKCPSSNTSSSSSHPEPQPVYCDLPVDYQFTLRNVPPAVYNQPSMYNYSRVFTVISDDGVLLNKWTLIKHSELFLMLCTFTDTTPGNTPVTERTLIVNTDFTWKAIANNNCLTALSNIPDQITTTSSFVKLLHEIDQATICPGIKDTKLVELAKMGGRNGIFKDSRGNVRAKLVADSIRLVKCYGLTDAAICNCCKSFKRVLQTMSNSSQKATLTSTLKTSTGSHCPWMKLNEDEKNDRIKNGRRERQLTSRKIKGLEEKLKEELISLNDDDNQVVDQLFTSLVQSSTTTSSNPDDFKTLFIKEQQKLLACTDARARRWHPLVIRWCFQLHSTSPKAYQQLKDSGVLILPDKRTLRDYSNCFKVDAGFNPEFLDLVKKDFKERSNPKEYDNWVGIIHDEVSLRNDLVFDDSGKLIGFVNLGSVQNHIDDLEQCLSSHDSSSVVPEEATHMFVFMVISLFSDWKMPVAFFPTTTIKSYALFNVFWKCVEELEHREFNVLTSTCDGASPHRKFYKFHHPPDTPAGTLIFKTTNPFSTEARPLYFICDPVHLLKTTRNNWENSFWRNKTKKLQNNGMLITWLQLIDAFENDVNDSNASGLRVLHKLTADHLFLNPYLRMRVYLAAQVFSNRVAHALTVQGKAGTEETVKFVKNMNDFFDCLNANRVCTQFEFKSVYRTSLDRRLQWLEGEFLKYFQDWKDWAMNQVGVPLSVRKQYFLSDQTWEGLQICVHSFVEVVKFCLTIPGVSYVVATKFNQDPLEKFLAK